MSAGPWRTRRHDASRAHSAERSALDIRGPAPGEVCLRVNGAEHITRIEPRVSLLDALREPLHLTGTKKGCDQGTCGACTVWVDRRRVLACLTLAVTCEGHDVTTIEGLVDGEALHPMQRAFITNDAFQCGYCTPGQIISAVALLEEGHASDEAEWQHLDVCWDRMLGPLPSQVGVACHPRIRALMEPSSSPQPLSPLPQALCSDFVP